MSITGFIFVMVAYYLCGKGMLRLFKVDTNPVSSFWPAMIIGVPIVSLAPCFVQLFHFPIALMPVSISIVALTILCSIPLLIKPKKPVFKKPVMPMLYEWPFLVVIAVLIFTSAWRCFYYPPYARDMLAGPELLAEYAVREQNMISSVFTVDLHTTNNHFKSPFITGLQIVYKLLVCSFGQLWLTVLFVGLTLWLYALLKQRIHPWLAGFLMLFFITIPELFAYSYMILYDYSNMVFFFFGFYFLARHLASKKMNELFFASFLLGLATYIRSETVVLAGLFIPLMLVYYYRDKMKPKNQSVAVGILLGLPVFFYVLCIHVFVKNFVPFELDVQGEVNQHLTDVSAFFVRFWEIQTRLVFSAMGESVYGYFIWFFYAIVLVDIAWLRRFNEEARIALYGVLVVFAGMALVGYLIPIADLGNTTKRGLFKVLPIMLLYLANSCTLQQLAELVRRWEYYPGKKRAEPAATNTKDQ